MIETNRIEFKRELTPDLDLEKEVVAFLNYHEGGMFYIGIDDDGLPVGVKDIDVDMLKIKDRIRTGISPSPMGLFDVKVGMNRIMRTYGRENFEFGNNYVRMIVPYNWMPENDEDGNEEKEQSQKTDLDAKDVGCNVGSLSEVQLTDRQKKICHILKENPYASAKQMSEVLSVVQRTIERDLAVLQQKNIIRHLGNTSGGHWEIG